jgi:hypothetical protein
MRRAHNPFLAAFLPAEIKRDNRRAYGKCCVECGARALTGNEHMRLESAFLAFERGDLLCFACWFDLTEDGRAWGHA